MYVGSTVEAFEARGLTVRLLAPNVGSAFLLDGARGVEIVGNTISQSGACARGAARVFEGHHVERLRIAANNVHWSCAAFGFDISDAVVIEDNTFNGSAYRVGDPTGNGIWTYDIHGGGRRPSSSLWSIARNAFVRPA